MQDRLNTSVVVSVCAFLLTFSLLCVACFPIFRVSMVQHIERFGSGHQFWRAQNSVQSQVSFFLLLYPNTRSKHGQFICAFIDDKPWESCVASRWYICFLARMRLVDIRVGTVKCWWNALFFLFLVYIGRRFKTSSLQLYNVLNFLADGTENVRWMNKWIWIYIISMRERESPFIRRIVLKWNQGKNCESWKGICFA